MKKLKKSALRLFSAIIVLQARFLAWQVSFIAEDLPGTVYRVSDLLDIVDKRELPREVRMLISKLVVARRRGIGG